ncbi:MAG: helix-turn-helix domain-containing protein [Chryseobacterium sp.]|jgi:AraC-like DNA-binding protein|uniref:helix-turn-helix domain-containing protein n=1 Tax=Chryseobacterium sp. TaxID=1871047 RepID=UPI00283166BC|nr:helix-turn-helix domain-containing protein [Chryseobacterium sp.]MDR2235909.1 helix-turn-helix domain-containing protein [Chryseobacterium sp.]
MRLLTSVLLLSVMAFQSFTYRPFDIVYTVLRHKLDTTTYHFTDPPKLKPGTQIAGKNDLEVTGKETSTLLKLHSHEKRLYSVTIIIILIMIAGLMHLVSSVHLQNSYYKSLYLREVNRQDIQSRVQRAETELKKEMNIFELTEINPLIVESILNALIIFEKEKKYLDKSASLANLAKECGTNTSYLSKVINHYKQQNFASYLNDLRLNHAVELWQKHPKLRYKSIQGMAGMTGFNTAQSFSKKFQEKYNTSPTHFLKNLEQNVKAG